MGTRRSDPPTPAAREHAERIFPPPPRSEGNEVLFDEAAHAFTRLRDRLQPVIGPSGCDALFRRSLGRAATRHPLLDTVRLEPDPDGLVGSLRQHSMRDDIQPESLDQIESALREVIAEHVALLTRFIGEELVRTILDADEELGRDPRPEDEAR